MTNWVEPRAMREIHEIRERHYERTKNWTPEQIREEENRIGEEMAKKLHLRMQPHKSRQPKRKAG
jgi:hypothetical protein